MRNLIWIGLAIVSLYLAWFSYKATQDQLIHTSAPLQDLSEQSLVMKGFTIAQLDNTLEFMVWPEPRAKLQREYTEWLKYFVQQRPLSWQAWSRLVGLQFETGASISDQLWSFAHFLDLRDWDLHSQLRLAFYCIELDVYLPQDLLSRCDRLLQAMNWSKGLRSGAKHIKVSEQVLAARLQRAGVGF